MSTAQRIRSTETPEKPPFREHYDAVVAQHTPEKLRVLRTENDQQAADFFRNIRSLVEDRYMMLLTLKSTEFDRDNPSYTVPFTLVIGNTQLLAPTQYGDTQTTGEPELTHKRVPLCETVEGTITSTRGANGRISHTLITMTGTTEAAGLTVSCEAPMSFSGADPQKTFVDWLRETYKENVFGRRPPPVQKGRIYRP